MIPKQPEVEGKLTIPTEMFNKDLLEKLFRNPHFIPIIQIDLRKIFLMDGLTLESNFEGSKIILDFMALEIDVQEQKA